jgi:hypothetical protein
VQRTGEECGDEVGLPERIRAAGGRERFVCGDLDARALRDEARWKRGAASLPLGRPNDAGGGCRDAADGTAMRSGDAP